MPYSYPDGKKEVRNFFKKRCPKGAKILDVGPGAGAYWDLLNDLGYFMDCVEIFEPYIERFKLKEKYDNVYLDNVMNFDISNYDVIILGDVLEHLSVEDAQTLLTKINNNNQKCLIAVPYLLEQGEFENNKHEIHLQADLTPEIMLERYPSLKLLAYIPLNYGYYINKTKKKRLKIVQISCVYNEMDYLPSQLKYIKSQGLDVYVIDNCSTDGTWEWLQENKIPSHQFDTDNMFDLVKNQSELTETAKKLKADWVYFADADLFPVSQFFKIREFIEIADSQGYNSIFSDSLHLCNTGEKRKGLFDTYFYGEERQQWLKIVKTENLNGLIGDGIALDKYKSVQKIDDEEIFLFNFGMTKSKSLREETLKRRKKAWENGMNENFGAGFIHAQKKQWMWHKEDLIDGRKEYKGYFDNLMETVKEDVGLLPHFEEFDTEMFYKYLGKCENYLEFGCGGSTYQACLKGNIEKIYSIESDKKWIEKVEREVIKKSDKSGRVRFIYNEMQSPPNSWGHPGINATEKQMKSYSSCLKNLTESEISELDLILIDGRFRVACCLKCYDLISYDCFVIFDDFLNREHYHIVLDYYDIVEKTSNETMVVLKKKKDADKISKGLIESYELQTD